MPPMFSSAKILRSKNWHCSLKTGAIKGKFGGACTFWKELCEHIHTHTHIYNPTPLHPHTLTYGLLVTSNMILSLVKCHKIKVTFGTLNKGTMTKVSLIVHFVAYFQIV